MLLRNADGCHWTLVLACGCHSESIREPASAAAVPDQTADVRPAVFCSWNMSEPTIFLIRPYRGGWQCFEAPGVQPYWCGAKAKEHAISYARNCRTANRHGEIRVLNAAGEIGESIAFDERANCLRV